MMAYAQLYHAPRLTLLYPHHSGLGRGADVHARYKITGHATILVTSSIDVSNSADMPARLRRLLRVGEPTHLQNRESVLSGQSVAVSVDFGVRRSHKKKQ